MIELFFKHPLGAIGYGTIILALISIWIYRKFWVWGPLLALSLSFAYYGNLIDLQSLIPISAVGVCYYFSSKDLSGFWRLFSSLTAAIITIALYTHFVKGFNNILLFPNWRASIDAIPINIYANYDKAVVALLILALYTPVVRSKKELQRTLFIALPWMIFSSLVILSLSSYLQIIKWDPKLPLISLTWLTIQIFFIIIPEEVFYRGFLQHEISKNLNNRFGGVFAVLAISLLFTLIHLFFIQNLSFLSLVFVASILYGTVYQITGKIESAILTHFFVNTCHFFFFTYPMLAL